MLAPYPIQISLLLLAVIGYSMLLPVMVAYSCLGLNSFIGCAALTRPTARFVATEYSRPELEEKLNGLLTLKLYEIYL